MKTKKYMIPNQRRIIRKQSEDLHRFIEQFLKIRERGRRGRGSSPIRHDYSQSPAILSGRFSAERLILDSEINYSRRAKSLMIATSCNSVILPDTTHEPRDERLDRSASFPFVDCGNKARQSFRACTIESPLSLSNFIRASIRSRPPFRATDVRFELRARE